MKLRIAPAASREMQLILDHLREESPAAANGLSARLDDLLTVVRDFPRTGRATDRRNIRCFNAVPYPYLVFYRVSRSLVEITAVRHGARNPPTE